MADEILEISELNVAARSDAGDVTIIDGLSLSVRRGEILGLVGESGCGKSVSMDAVMGLLGPGLEIKSGQITFHGEIDLATLRRSDKKWQALRGKRIGMIFQEPMSSFSPLYTIGDQISDVVRHHLATAKKETRNRVLDLLETVGMPEPRSVIDRYPFELSGGLRQRAMIAKALACGPELLIADEPTTALDVTVQADILDLLRDLASRLGMALVFISHDLAVIASVCDRIAVMYAGSIVEEASVGQIFADPKHPYTQALLRTLPHEGPAGQRLEPIPGAVPSPEARPAGCPFHPRCKFFQAGSCDQIRPTLVDQGDGHQVACPVVTGDPS